MTALTQTLFTPFFVAERTSLIARLAHMLEVAHQRRALSKLDADQLADLGISLQAAVAESQKPLWDLPK